jgi:hypothetical protein
LQGILTVINESGFFSSIDVIELIDEGTVNLLKVKARVKDSTLLYITELHTPAYQKYSYHWQKENGEVIIRWDNKPHWRNLKTFPYHKHEKDKVLPSYRVGIDDVISTIRERIK